VKHIVVDDPFGQDLTQVVPLVPVAALDVEQLQELIMGLRTKTLLFHQDAINKTLHKSAVLPQSQWRDLWEVDDTHLDLKLPVLIRAQNQVFELIN